MEWKLRQERGVFGVKAEVRAVEVEKEEHEERLIGISGVGVTRWISIHVERCGMEADSGAWSLRC